jgi:hypothetical protein
VCACAYLSTCAGTPSLGALYHTESVQFQLLLAVLFGVFVFLTAALAFCNASLRRQVARLDGQLTTLRGELHTCFAMVWRLRVVNTNMCRCRLAI